MNDGVMISFLPTNTDWCRQDFPHMTLVYCGTIEGLKPTALNELAKDAISVANLIMTGPFKLNVTGVEVFGQDPDPKVDVLTLYPTPQLLLARNLVEKWNASQHQDFNPHATIGPEGSAWGNLPANLYFDRIAVSWGPKYMYFQL